MNSKEVHIRSGSWRLLTVSLLIIILGTMVFQESRYTERRTASAALNNETAGSPEYSDAKIPAARLDGNFPCIFAQVDRTVVSPQLGKCAMPPLRAGAVDRFEADLRDGNFVLRQTDLHLNDVFDVPLTRSYRSNDWLAPTVHAFGRNSNHPYDIAPLGTRYPYTYQLLVLEDGEFLYFDRISKGTGFADAVYRHTETSTRFYNALQSWDGNGWKMKLTDGSEIFFPEAYGAKNLAQGASFEMRNANGDRLELRRDSQGNLQQIITPHKHWIKFRYDESARINRAEDDAGEWCEYQYNSDGMLTTVLQSSGRQRHYEYEGALMTKISDESGNVLLRNQYQSGFLIRQEFGSGEVYLYSYDWPRGTYYPRKVVITLPNGTSQELSPADSVPEFLRNYHP